MCGMGEWMSQVGRGKAAIGHSVFYVLYSGGFYIALSWQVTHLSSFPSLTAGVPAFQSRTVWRVLLRTMCMSRPSASHCVHGQGRLANSRFGKLDTTDICTYLC